VLKIPEIGLEMETGMMGSIYTTVEGLLDHIHDNIKASNPFGVGDSAEDLKFKTFLNKIKEVSHLVSV